MNFFKTSIRSLIKSRMNTSISILGLAIGFVAAIVIVQYNFYETSYDSFHDNKGDIYRVIDYYKNSTTSNIRATSFYHTAETFQRELPEVKRAVHVAFNSCVFKQEDNIFKIDKVALTHPSYFEIFSYRFLDGGYEKLDDPNTLIISKSMARKLFGSDAVVGKSIDVKGLLGIDFTAKVIGVFEDLPPNSNLVGEVFFSANKFDEFVNYAQPFGPNVGLEQQGWRVMGFYTYLKVEEGTNINELNKKVASLTNYYRKEINKELNQQHDVTLQPLLSIHTTPGFQSEMNPAVSGNILNLFYVIALLIILMAWINYINLSTARAIDRAKEVGMRKVMGATKVQLVWQFLTESFLVGLVGLLMALVIIYIFNGSIENVLGKKIFFDTQQDVIVIALSFLIMIVGATLAGIYPAFVLTSYNPIIVLKGKIKYSGSGVLLRRSLVLFQFFIAIAMLSSLFIIRNQLSFMMEGDIGIQIDHTITIPLPGAGQANQDYASKIESLRDQLMLSLGITRVATSSIVPGITDLQVGTTRLRNKPEGSIFAHLSYVDHHFIDLFQLKLIAGRAFSENFVGDRKVCVINRKAAESFGFHNPQDAPDNTITIRSGHSTIIGVVENFNQAGLQMAFEPIIMELDTMYANSGYLNVKFVDDDYKSVLSSTQEIFKQVFPMFPYEYNFLDETFQKQYGDDKKFGEVFTFFAAVAIVIAILGLFGVAAFSAYQKRKEVSIRKVLGSNLSQIFVLLNREYIVLSILSFIIAIPVTYYSMEQWLGAYHNRVTISFGQFVLPFVIIQAIVLVVTTYQTYSTAVVNPTKMLREQ